MNQSIPCPPPIFCRLRFTDAAQRVLGGRTVRTHAPNTKVYAAGYRPTAHRTITKPTKKKGPASSSGGRLKTYCSSTGQAPTSCGYLNSVGTAAVWNSKGLRWFLAGELWISAGPLCVVVIAFSYEYFAVARVGARGLRATKTDKLSVIVHFTVNDSFAHLVCPVKIVPAWTQY